MATPDKLQLDPVKDSFSVSKGSDGSNIGDGSGYDICYNRFYSISSTPITAA